MTKTTTRRAFAAGLALAPAAALPAVAGERKPPAFADAIERHRKLYAEWSAACGRNDEPEMNRLCDATNAVLREIIEAPCVDDAELLVKLRYLVEAERRLSRAKPEGGGDWECVAQAAFRHFYPEV